MSRNYEMKIWVDNPRDGKLGYIRAAVEKLGYGSNCDWKGTRLVFDPQDIHTSSSRLELECLLADKVIKAIWEANGAWCKVRVTMRDLDVDTPTHEWNKDDYNSWVANKGSTC